MNNQGWSLEISLINVQQYKARKSEAVILAAISGTSWDHSLKAKAVFSKKKKHFGACILI